MPPPALPSYATAPTPSASGIVSTPAPFNVPTPSSASNNAIKQFNAASAKALVDADGNLLSGIEGDVVETADDVGKSEAVPSVPEITAVQGIVPTLQ